MAGLTEAGFKRRTYDEIVSDKISKAKELFGADINTDENTPLGKFIRINAYDEASLSEDMELVYYSLFPNTAMGVSLDRLCVFIGISRNPAIAARYKIEINGTAGTEVPIGFLVGTESEIEFYNIVATEIGEDGTAIITCDCTESGEIGNVNPQDITQIINPAANIDSIVSAELVYKGEETESDYNLRKRFETARSGLGSGNVPSLINSVLSVPTVTSVGIVENDSDVTDSGNRPPHSFECYVCGGENYHNQIAQKIFEKKPIGIKTAGTQSVNVVDEAGNTHTIKFSHTTTVDVYVSIKIQTDLAFNDTDGIAKIKDNIENYINSLGIGNSVYISSLYGQVHSVNGVKAVPYLKLSIDNVNWSTDNIIIENYKSCICKNVEVQEVT